MKHSCKLMYQKYLTVEELYVAFDVLNWFADEAMSGKVKFDEKEKKWITDPNLQLPSWKHITRGGHKQGRQLQRGAIGIRCAGRGGPSQKEFAYKLIFRRHSRDQRIFVVQRADMLSIRESQIPSGCMCKTCAGELPNVSSKLKMEDLELYKEL